MKKITVECGCCGKKVDENKTQSINITANGDPRHSIKVCQKCYDEYFKELIMKKLEYESRKKC
ncbi:MAG: hypothetical protein PHF86_10605 [Candidatus Nanoarchaeia archaeon]|nr:hypothetical protein [Candidatus Nanoarchaeia archaeon]